MKRLSGRSDVPFFGDAPEMLAQLFAELLAAVLQVGPPPLPTRIAKPLFGVDVPDRHQDARLLTPPKSGFDTVSKTRIVGERFM